MLAIAIAMLGAAACGSQPGPNGPSATALSQPALQHAYEAAAGGYNRAEVPIAQAEETYCSTGTAAANLGKCEAALSQDRQATIAYDNALRALAFPAAARGDVATLLSDDSRLEDTLEQASTAPSLAVVNDLRPQVLQLIAASGADATKVRADIGLPAASPLPSPSNAA